MLEIFRSIMVGGVQGVAEFLPISSSGHLVIIPYLFHWDYQGLAFDVALHFGTVIAIIVYFWKDWMKLIANGLSLNRQKDLNTQTNNQSTIGNERLNYPKNLLWMILVASIPAAIVGVLINDYVENNFHSPLLIAINLAFFGWLLWYVDRRKAEGGRRKLDNLSYKQAFWIGLAQSVALVPGVSRAGITITAGRSLGLSREQAARFSFLLATPAMIGAFLLKLKDIEKTDLNLSFWLGVISATILGFLAIKYLLQYLKKSDFSVFLWYRVALAIILIAIYFSR